MGVRAGASGSRAAGHVQPADPTATDLLRLRVAAGVVTTDTGGVSDRCRRAMAVATSVGAPLLDAVDAAVAAEDDHRQAARAVRVASAQTRAVAIGLVGAPVLLVPGLGRLVGADLVGFYTSPVGALILLAAIVMLSVGAGIIVVLVRRVGRRATGTGVRSGARARGLIAAVLAGLLAWRLVGPALTPIAALLAQHLATRRMSSEPEPAGVDEAADLAALALAGGAGIAHALRLAADHLPELAVPLRRLAFELELGIGPGPTPRVAPGSGIERLRSVLFTAGEVGAAVAPTLRRLAGDLRADALADVLADAERLPAQLTFPTALCLLPATVLLVGAPIVHAGLVTAGT